MSSGRPPADVSRSDTTTILVPVRYPLTDTSVKTLRHATALASENATAELLVLHVNLVHHDKRAKRAEISQAIAPIVDDTDASLLLRNAFLIEESITEEALEVGADRVVIGETKRPRWRQFFSQLFGNEPYIGEHIREHTNATVDIVE